MEHLIGPVTAAGIIALVTFLIVFAVILLPRIPVDDLPKPTAFDLASIIEENDHDGKDKEEDASSSRSLESDS